MKEFRESRLRFRFSDAWHVVQWDQETAYRKHIEKLKISPHEGAPPQCRVGEKTRGIDFLGLHGSRLYLIEAKNARGDEQRFDERIKSGSLFAEVGFKVRDTLAGLSAALLRQDDEEKWGRFRPVLLKGPISVVLWLERHGGAVGKGAGAVVTYKAEMANHADRLRKYVGWLTPNAVKATCVRIHREEEQVPDLVVENEPEKGQ